MEDDDVFLVIIADESGEMKIPGPIQIKQECTIKEEPMSVEDIIQTAEKHGECVRIKLNSQNEYEYLDGDESQLKAYLKLVKTENVKEEQSHEELEYESYDDTEDEPEPVEKKKKKKKKEKEEKKASKTMLRRSMLSPQKHKSFVEDLREQYPELRTNKKLLVKTLSEIMCSVKRPPLPHKYCLRSESGYRCSKCGHESGTIPAAARHYREKHGPRYLLCYACGVDFRSTTNLYKHEKRCIAKDRRVVLMARAACLGNKGRGRPFLDYRTHQPPKVAHKSFPCEECSAVFNTRTNLISHVYMHRGERPFQCEECPAAYTSYSGLLRHSKKHRDIEFICDHCQRSFKLKAALVAHMDTHRPVRKFGCDRCERRFAQKQALQLHVDRVHNNLPPPHACQICPKRYPRLSILKAHMKKEHGLLIMTRKMFFKKLPMLSEAEMKQAAKLVFKNEEPEQIYLNQDDQNTDSLDEQCEESANEESYILCNTDEQDLVEYFKQFTEQNGNMKGAKTIIIQNGEVVEVQIGEM